MANRREAVEAPIATPPRFGLVAAAPRVDAADRRWENGLTYLSECIGAHGTGDPCDPDQNKGGAGDKTTVGYDPFYVWTSQQCSAMDQGVDWAARARRALEAITPFELEAEFWTGAQAIEAGFSDNRYLAHPTSADVMSDAALAPDEALACLEYGIGRCPGSSEGWIHAPRNLVSIWSDAGKLTQQGNTLRTIMGTVVVPGTGYDGSGPGGVDASDGSVWAYATGPVQVRYSEAIVIGEEDLASQIARATNDLEVIAERVAAVTWDGCCHIAVQVDAPFCDVGPATY